MFKTIKPLALAAVMAALCTFAGPASARGADSVTYTVVSGDTLHSIARRYLKEGATAGQLQRINRVRNPRRLSIDRTLRIPRQMLKYDDVQLTVDTLAGDVTIAGGTPVKGRVLSVGQEIVTQRNGFISFVGTYGGRISLPSNTTAVLERARLYTLGNTLDVDFRVIRGRVNATSPTLEGQGRLRMRTPLATTAVRGTEFRVAYDPQNSDVSLTEVTEGEVQVAAGNESRAAPAGFGVSSSATGVSEPEALLPPPVFVDGNTVQTGETLNFAFEPVSGAQGYRVQIAKDLGHNDIITEQVVDTETVEFAGLDNARYYVRARSISPSGLEGLLSLESESFLRKRLDVAGVAGEDLLFDGFKFTWTPESGGSATFAFQLWLQDAPEVLLFDQVGLTETEITLTNLANGKYDWRVAVAETDPEEGLIKVWGPVQTFNVND